MVNVNATATVVNVSSTKPDGSYNAGTDLNIIVIFDQNVNVDDTPILTLKTGTIDENAYYTGGSGTDTLTFKYTVQAGDTSSDLDYNDTNALVGGRIYIGSVVTEDANLILPPPGDINSLSYNKNIIIDTTVPTGYSVSIDQSYINNSNKTALSFTFAGAEVGTTYNYSIDNSIIGSPGFPVTGFGQIITTTDQITGIDVSSLMDGTLILSVTLTDIAGNEGSTTTDTVVKDVAAPTTSGAITAGTTGINGWYTSDVTYTITPADALSGVASTSYCVDTNNTCTPNITYSSAITLSTEGDNYIRFSSTDNVGNVQAVQSSGLIKIDKITPTVNAGSNITTNTLSQTLSTATATDTGGSGIATYNWTKTSGSGTVTFTNNNLLNAEVSEITADDTYTLQLEVTDNAGNINTDTMTFVYDTTAPTTSGAITAGTTGINGWYTSDVTYTITPADALSGVASTSYCVDTNNTCTPNTTYSSAITLSTEGDNYIRFSSTDNVGNVQSVQSSGLIKIDTIAPVITITPLTTTDTNNIVISGTNDDTTIDLNITVNGNDYIATVTGTTWTATITDELPISTYDINFTAIDIAGNTTSDTKNAVLNIISNRSHTGYAFYRVINQFPRYASLITNHQLASIHGWTGNGTLITLLDSSEGPLSQRLNSDDVDTIWVYSNNAWTTVDHANFGNWNFNNYNSGFTGYYVLGLNYTASTGKKYIRHN